MEASAERPAVTLWFGSNQACRGWTIAFPAASMICSFAYVIRREMQNFGGTAGCRAYHCDR